ncbi:MAG TPA: hypothetical protein VFV23_07990 [Verrucomicrobiae bacterium]|nr:hypothetical protein [Verrucomicrobiae bacterium]
MRVSASSQKSRRSAYALLMTLVFVGVLLTMFASVMYWAATNAKITKRNNLYNQSEAAAESAVELTRAAMMRDFQSQQLNSAGSYETNALFQTNWPIQFQITDTNGIVDRVSVTMGDTNWTESLPAQYSGLYGFGQECTICAIASPLNEGENLSAAIKEKIWFGTIPIFEYAIFYNVDLEINPGAEMVVNGKVHSNKNIYATGSSGSQQLTFSDIVEAANKVNLNPSPDDPQNVGRSGNVTFKLKANNPASNVNSLNLPIGGTNRDPAVLRAILGLPPSGLIAPDPSAYSSSGQLYPYNEADIIVSNSSTEVLTAYYDNGNDTVNPLQQIYPDVTNIVKTGKSSWTTNIYFSFITNVVFYDYREMAYAHAVQVDVDKFRVWLTNSDLGGKYDFLNSHGSTSKGHHINSMYVWNGVNFIQGSTSADGTLPAVRLANGTRLPPYGFTLATAQPIYIKGDYNTTQDGVHFALTQGSTTNTDYTVPAAVMGDAVTILSDQWADGTKSNGNGISGRNADDTTINAACFEGIVTTGNDKKGNPHYSGGVENFLRLLENWSPDILTYNGSIVVMFPSQYAVSPWQKTGNYYNPPKKRNWGFDTSFYSQNRIPPMTPGLKAVINENYTAGE